MAEAANASRVPMGTHSAPTPAPTDTASPAIATPTNSAANGADPAPAPNTATITNGTPNGVTTNPPPPILCLGMARTGTASLAAALRILGIPKVHHGLEIGGPEFEYQWEILDRAADATFPTLPTYTGKPFTRADWDSIFGPYDAVTDIASFYATSLIAAYPDAKVILVERDYDKWLTSITPVFAHVASQGYHHLARVVGRLIGSSSAKVCIKFEMGWARARKPKEMFPNVREAYERHYREIRATVPKEQLLDYQLAQGWGPLCEFLGKPVPDVPFPHVNDAAAYKAYEKRVRNEALRKAGKNVVKLRFKEKKSGGRPVDA